MWSEKYAMSYVAIVQDLPRDLQFPMLKLVEAVQQDMRAELAVRRSDFDRIEAAVAGLTQTQKRTERRVDRLEIALVELAQAQKRTEERVEELAQAQKRTEERVEELAQAQKRTEERVEELAQAQKRTEERVEELAQAQKRTEERVEELAQAQKRTEAALHDLATTQKAMLIDLSQLVGERLERQYRDRAPAYFGRILRRTRALSLQDLEIALEPHLTEDELADALLLDAVISGLVAGRADALQVVLALEVSSVIDRGDVERAVRRAALLRKAGMLAVPTVAGPKLTQGAADIAQSAGVLLVQDGQRAFWEEALAGVLNTAG
jgi:hypothetical protein